MNIVLVNGGSDIRFAADEVSGLDDVVAGSVGRSHAPSASSGASAPRSWATVNGFCRKPTPATLPKGRMASVAS